MGQYIILSWFQDSSKTGCKNCTTKRLYSDWPVLDRDVRRVDVNHLLLQLIVQ